MKSIPNMLIAAAFACMAAGCGQAGPLYMPAKPAPVAAPTAPAPANSTTSGTTPASK